MAFKELRAGLAPVSVSVTATDVTGTGVGSITTSPLIFNATDASKSTGFSPAAARSSLVQISTPAGFSTPTQNQTLRFNAFAPTISVADVVVGKDLHTCRGPRRLARRASRPRRPASSIQVLPARLNPTTLNVVTTQEVRGGASINVPVTAADLTGGPGVGAITTSPVNFTAGVSSRSTQFDPSVAGTSRVSIGVPTGFDTPSDSRQITVTVNPQLSRARRAVLAL